MKQSSDDTTIADDLATLRDEFYDYSRDILGRPRKEARAALERVEAEINYLRHNDHVLRAEAAEAAAARLRDGLRHIEKGSWNHGNVVPGMTVMDYARALLAEDGAAGGAA